MSIARLDRAECSLFGVKTLAVHHPISVAISTEKDKDESAKTYHNCLPPPNINTRD